MTINQIRLAKNYGKSVSPHDEQKLARYEARQAKRLAYWERQASLERVADERARKAAARAKAKRQHESSLAATSRIHRAA